MKTVLVGISAKYIHPSVALYSLSAYGKRFGIESEIREFTVNQGYDEIYYSLVEAEPDVLAFSVYIWNVSLVGRLLHDLRKTFPSAKLLIGGPEVSFGCPEIISEEDFDYLLSGEGERTFTALLMHLQGMIVPPEWGFSKEEKICRSLPVENLDELPFIYENQTESFKNRIIYYEASRGCPYHCSYCLSAAEDGLRVKSADKVISELTYLVEKGARLVKFLDRSFNAREELSLGILDYVASIPLDNPIRFHFEIEADTLTEKLLEAFENMPKGRVQLEIGIQSTHPETLSAVHRNPSVERLFANIRRLAAKGNLKIHTDLIAGLPYENLKTFAKSFSDVFGLPAQELQLGFLKRLQGAPIADETKWNNRYSKVAPYEILENAFLSPKDLAKLKRVEDGLDRFWNSGRFTCFFLSALTSFESPWAMFSALAKYLETKGLGYQPLGAMEEFRVLSNFSLECIGNKEELLISLLWDFYCFTGSDQLPEALMQVAARPENATELSLALLREKGQRERKLVCRFIKGKPVLWDYTEKDPVSERYENITD